MDESSEDSFSVEMVISLKATGSRRWDRSMRSIWAPNAASAEIKKGISTLLRAAGITAAAMHVAGYREMSDDEFRAYYGSRDLETIQKEKEIFNG